MEDITEVDFYEEQQHLIMKRFGKRRYLKYERKAADRGSNGED